MKLKKIGMLLCLCLIIITISLGCGATGQVRQCQADIHSLKIEKDYLRQEVQTLRETLKQMTKLMDSIKFDIGILQREVLNLKTGGPQPTSPEVVDRLIEQLKGSEADVPKISQQLREYGKSAVIALVMRLKETDIDFLRRVETTLEQMNPSEAAPVLIETLNQREIRSSAARILGSLKDRSSVLPLAEHLKDGDADFVFNVAESLVKLKDRRGIPVLIETLKGDNATRRSLAFDCLSKATGLTFDYKHYLSAEERLKSVKQWEMWWLKEGDKFEFKQ